MTEKVRRHIRRGWDISKVVGSVAGILMVLHSIVDLNAKVASQGEHQQTTASSMGALTVTVGKVAGKVEKLDSRVSRLERPPRIARATPLHGTAEVDTVAARSPGLVGAAVDLVSAPFRFLGAVFRGR